MDAVRFGRALGFGARHAVKTLTTAVDAATSENPSGKASVGGADTGRSATGTSPVANKATNATAGRAPVASPAAKAARTAARTIARGRETKRGIWQGSKRFGEAVWRPFVRLSGVLGLEVSGVFFGIFALFGLGEVWRLRGDWRVGSPQQIHLLGAVAMLTVFGYFCVSSFVRARRRERRR